MTEYITSKHEEKLPPGTKWIPTVGNETEGLLDYFSKKISKASCERLKNEAVRILSKCGNPKVEKNSETGLVFGYIQSGKTMSYTTLTALAKDNNYQIIIIIAGITNNLLNQTQNRLNGDLRINRNGHFEWKVLKNPDSKDKHIIQNVLDLNRKFSKIPQIPRKTILITVLKQATVLKKLVSLLKSLNLEKVPTLIIDDEGDQASMNTVARRNAKLNEKGMSTIYSRIIELKESVPHHTLLQYTATPQAPFFINIYDRLSPHFIELLDPGEDYVGGRELFKENPQLIIEIPDTDIKDKEEDEDTPPETLMESMRTFFLCVALGLSNRELIKSNHLSMMVHPSNLTSKHNVYHKWITKIRKRWMRILDEPTTSLEKTDLLSEFKKSYEALKKTNKVLPNFDSIKEFINPGLVTTDIHELNTKTGITDVEWSNYSYILVGGQVLDRGFTVEGLIITYMPRGIGVGNADSNEQRARFLGYKRKYLSFCRVYLSEKTKDFYEKYLLHEENLRNMIKEHHESGESLNKLRRRVMLSAELHPTRSNIISGEIKKYRAGDWFTIKAPHDSKEIIENNRKIIESFVKEQSWKSDEGHKKRTPTQIHDLTIIPLRAALERLLEDLKFTRETDTYLFTHLVNMINEYLSKNKEKKGSVYFMSGRQPRERRLSNKDEIEQLFQGSNSEKGELIYPGDREIKNSEEVSIQIHKLLLKDKETKKIIFNDIYTIAIWLPYELGRDYQELIENE